MLALIGIAKSNGVHDGHRSTPPARLDTTHPVTAVFLARLLKITLFIYQQDGRETQIHIGAQCCQCGALGFRFHDQAVGARASASQRYECRYEESGHRYDRTLHVELPWSFDRLPRKVYRTTLNMENPAFENKKAPKPGLSSHLVRKAGLEPAQP